jgi:hypothetical protein
MHKKAVWWMTGSAWTKMPPAIVAEGLALTKWGIGNCVRGVTKAAAPAARNSGKMICGRRELSICDIMEALTIKITSISVRASRKRRPSNGGIEGAEHDQMRQANLKRD